jgi:hypothetical protein
MRRTWLVIAGLLIVALAAGAWFGRDLYTTARIGTAYVAKQTCSCLFVASRAPQSCSEDYEADAVKPLVVQPAASSVTVSALGGLLSATAEFEDGFGCHLVN